MRDKLWWKTALNLKWRATFDGEQLTIEEDLRFHTAFTLSVSIGMAIQYQYEFYPGICIRVVNKTNFRFHVSDGHNRVDHRIAYNAKIKGEIIGNL